MKKIILSILCILVTVSIIQAQEKEDLKKEQISKKDSASTNTKGTNELKFNLLYMVFKTVELSYEKHLSDDSGLGISLGYKFLNEDEKNGHSLEVPFFYWSALPYYRFYFGKKACSGFFIEANASVAKADYVRESYDPSGYKYWELKDKIIYGAGFSTGAKFLTSKNFVGEIYLGLGTGFNYDDIYLRSGITIGKRF